MRKLLLGVVTAVTMVNCAFAQSGTPLPSVLYGVTVDDISRLSATIKAVGDLGKPITSRVVFDENEQPSYYTSALQRLGKVSHVMGEILDSEYMASYSVLDYKKRSDNYMVTLGPYVDLWEVGNEVNGEWLGNTLDVVEKIYYSWQQAKAHGYKTELTLYYNGPADDGSASCWSDIDHEMFNWIQNVPEDMRQGLDYVLVSYYPDDCMPDGSTPLDPSAKEWTQIFQKVSQQFPGAKVGLGEYGGSGSDNRAYMQEAYGLYNSIHPALAPYVGGVFWWYFKEECVPESQPLWSALRSSLAAIRP